jgi:hypothetical protein
MTGPLKAFARRAAARALRSVHPERRLVAREFDRAYYLSVNPDVAATGADPLDHFLAHGWQEGRDPNGRFSVREYLSNNPDVARSGANPFVHYLKTGRQEGRTAVHDLGFRYGIIARLRPLEDQTAEAQKAAAAFRAGSPASLAKAFAGLKDLHITFSQDDYRVNVGGVQLCVQREAERLAELGRDHLNLHPLAHWPVLRTAAEPSRLGVVLNGERLGAFAPEAVAAALAKAAPKGDRSFAIHSLLGHAAEETAAILEAAGLSAGFLWLHDYSSLCAGHNLLRNGVEDCAAPPPDSGACGICLYGPWRGRHLAAHEALFRRFRLTVVAPAAVTLAFWKQSWDFPAAGTLVHPHARLTPRGPGAAPSAERPLRVAFLGYPVAHKGWPLFRRLALAYAEDPRYRFLHFAAQREAGLPVDFHEVRVSARDPRAMQAALEAHEVDVVLFWPLWRETFSFAVYEAVAAGCAVVTGPDSGNVAAMVGEGDRGWVLPDEAALTAAFASGEIAALARARRTPMLYDLTLSGMTADLTPERARA